MQEYTVYLYLQTALHVSGGISTHHQELISLYANNATATCPECEWVRTSSRPVPFTTGSSNGLNNVRYCRYSDMSS